jgi:serine/threonine protein phosphatase PrpC
MGAQARITAFTHRGRVREANEDTVVVGEWVSEPEMAEPRAFRHALAEPLVCAVADGMGGHRGGAFASREVARRLAENGKRIGDPGATAAALHDIDAALYRAMESDANLRGMGTTVVGLVLTEVGLVLAPRLVWFNVGDSRLYRAGHDAVMQVSIDDTPLGRRSGLITQTLGGMWPPRGHGEPIAPHVGEELLATPARYLLCSDGLTDMLDDADIAGCLALPDTEAVAQLFERAMRAGGMDNISIVLVSLA